MSASDNIRMLNVKGRQKFPLFQKNSGQHIAAILSILHTHMQAAWVDAARRKIKI